MKKSPFDALLDFLSGLERKKISYELAHHRDDAIMVLVSAPGERWEVEFLSDGTVEIEKFRSDGKITDETEFGSLLRKLAG